MENVLKKMGSNLDSFFHQLIAAQDLFAGLAKYNLDFIDPLMTSVAYFGKAEISKFQEDSPAEVWNAYSGLCKFNIDLLGKLFNSNMHAVEGHINKEMEAFLKAFSSSLLSGKAENLIDFFARQFNLISGVSIDLPKAILDIEAEYGFHFENGENQVIAETDRFLLYKINPNEKDIKTDEKAKPILIIPPFVLGSSILGFLPSERKSYAHAFANQGIPTYFRISKDIQTTPAFQTMTMEDDALDTRYFCEKIMELHGKKVTLNGYCQGGYSAICNILSDELDDVVDALLTCVAPMDGTRSKGLGDFLRHLPPRFNDLLYGTKTLPNGNKVADGILMGWVYKLKSIEHEAPLASFLRDMSLLEKMDNSTQIVGKTAAAINYWLQNERVDIPLSITEMSFASYTIPVTEDGTLPVKIFGRELNFKGILEKGIPWLICYGEDDDLVEKETTLAPLDYISVETTPFPKGHVAIATSWSHPESRYALHTRFGPNKKYRGPVRFQLDLNEELEAKQIKKIAKQIVSTKPQKTEKKAPKQASTKATTAKKPKKAPSTKQEDAMQC